LTPTGWRRKLLGVSEEESQIRNYLDRPGRYVNIDGTNELTWGALLWGMALMDRFPAATPRWVQLAYVPLMALAVHFGGKALKRYVTYPRTGFGAYPDPLRTRMTPVIAVVLAIAATFAAAEVIRSGLQMVVLLGLVNVLYYAAAAHPLRGWKWGFLLLIAAGPLWIRGNQALPFFGFAFLTSGITTLALYLRSTR
jgi:hypothetical protein